VFAVTGLVAGGAALAIVIGYLLWLGRARATSAPAGFPPPCHWPRVDVIVPVHQEAAWIEDKLRNLAALVYPAGALRFWIVDGASTDGTSELVEAWTRRDRRFALVRMPVADKTTQLNAALRRTDAEWVLVTDADARLEPRTLVNLLAAGEADPLLAVIGTPVQPVGACAPERLHWSITNRLRERESRRGCASFVTGPCYLFRRVLLPTFPADVVADDVHVALTAARQGWRVGFVRAGVTELRAPANLRQFVRHKFRKADGYLREIRRFLPQAQAMPSPARELFLWRAAQLMLVPVLVAVSLVALAGWVITDGHAAASPLVAVSVALLLLAPSVTWRPAAALLWGLALGIILSMVVLAAFIASPLWRQSACYARPLPLARPEQSE
jgi:cellulose synthase/poly-beta-1,6-N-acetylglucosamine synthase-like glycosyltransferase